MDALDTDFTIATPAFPDNGRTVFKGHLFVGDVLLTESGMRNHPLTPMTDSNLVRVLQAQCAAQGRADRLPHGRGRAPTRSRSASRNCAPRACRIAIVDALGNDDLLRLGPALKDMPLVTAGSGVAIGLPANFGIAPSNAAAELPRANGLRAVVSGSCSVATNRQVRDFIVGGRPGASRSIRCASPRARTWPRRRWPGPRRCSARGPVLVYSTADAAAVKAVQEQLGVERSRRDGRARARRHRARAGRARRAPAGGGRRRDLGRLRAGAGHHAAADRPADRPRRAVVPRAHRQRRAGLHLALKSGNFGADDFFTKAFRMLA